MSNKFKVGDRVKVTEVTPIDQDLFGQVGTVTNLGWLFPYQVALDNLPERLAETDNKLYFYDDELEAVNE